MAVDGVGAVVLPVPPLAVVYQTKVSDANAFFALNAEAVAPWQYSTKLTTIGLLGVRFTTTLMLSLGPSQFKFVLALTQ